MITPFRSHRLRSVNRPALLALTGAGLFLASLDAYVVVTALLPMLKSVNIAVNRPEQATPIITGFLLGYLAVMPVAGGLSDRFGRLRLFAASLALFAFGLQALHAQPAQPRPYVVLVSLDGFRWDYARPLVGGRKPNWTFSLGASY